MSKLRTDFKDEILQEGETHRVYNIKRKGTDEVVESEVYLEKAYEALQEGDEFGAKDVNEIHVRLNGLASMNLLLNSDFRNPVNQRDNTTYKPSSSAQPIYSIDRWFLYGAMLSLTKNQASITLSATSSGPFFIQKFESVLPKGKYTVSCNVLSLSGGNAIVYFGENTAVGNLKQGYNKFTIDMQSTFNQLMIGFSDVTTLELEYIKLEQGSIATPFVPRPYAEELALCQRYYRKTSLSYYYFFTGDSGTVFSTSIQCPMRVKPSITLDSAPTTMRSSASSYVTTTIALSSSKYSLDLLTMHFTSSANLGVRVPVWAYENFNISLDAEIY